MNREDLIKMAGDFVENSPDNYINEQLAISPDLVGIKIFEAPLFGFGAPDDAYFNLFKRDSIIGQHYMLPREWLPRAQTVISFFLPFSLDVKKATRKTRIWPSNEWLHGRIEGQAFINRLCAYLKGSLNDAGFTSLVPSLDERFWAQMDAGPNSKHPGLSYTSTWSERHAAFVCGLGTFGLSRGLITARGIAGRFGSIISELYLPADERQYEEVSEFCSMCGHCVKRCPVAAISIEEGKNHSICSAFLDRTTARYSPRYGCGKCQTGVPCESRIPPKNNP
ncbi:MAG: epoxyqueuosine reductase [Syntrophomonadaceae bacterium]